MMAVIGGSSGVLYGSAYLRAAKAVKAERHWTAREFVTAWKPCWRRFMSRGQAKERI